MKKNSSKWNTDGYDGNTDGRVFMDMASNSNSGLRLRNDSRVECYLNTAINTVVTNEILMGEVIREDPLKQWGMDILLLHDPNYDPNREITHTGILTALAAFSSDTTGCSNSHGELCFTSVKNQITGHIKNLKFLDELKRLIFQEGGIRGARSLK